MFTTKRFLKESTIRIAFGISLIAKGFLALLEVTTGIAGYFVTQKFLIDTVNFITEDELREEPKNYIANHLLHSAQNVSLATQHFTALYLLSHGIIKLWLIIGLARKKLWYYPAATAVFSLFVVYQIYRFTYTHSLWLLVLSGLDILMIILTQQEYYYLQREFIEKAKKDQL